ncbi:MAG: hypothetical protein LBT89_12610 [Planctomycetaceae bacterium]|nr:hypothetical protein [Planctomycetaceae bacterium]
MRLCQVRLFALPLTEAVGKTLASPKLSVIITETSKIKRKIHVSSHCSKYSFCCVAVTLIVLLRLVIGWHFFYEGLHKFDPAEGFSAKGFLGISKGPTAQFYYNFLPDLDGIERLEIGTIKDAGGKDAKTFTAYEKAWDEYYARYLKKYPNVKKEDADAVFNRYLASLRAGAADTEKDIAAFKGSRERFLQTKADLKNDTAFEQKRRWDAMMAYRSEAEKWTGMLDKMGGGLQSDLGRLANPELAGQSGGIVTDPEKGYLRYLPNPFIKTQMKAMDMAVMYGLSAIGLCMMLGFCNRLACLGGAVFLVNVVLTTFPVPGVYPPLPTAVGNFMFVSKDVVELVAMLFLASIPAGRWAGLDYFLWHGIGEKLCRRFCKCGKEHAKECCTKA